MVNLREQADDPVGSHVAAQRLTRCGSLAAAPSGSPGESARIVVETELRGRGRARGPGRTVRAARLRSARPGRATARRHRRRPGRPARPTSWPRGGRCTDGAGFRSHLPVADVQRLVGRTLTRRAPAPDAACHAPATWVWPTGRAKRVEWRDTLPRWRSDELPDRVTWAPMPALEPSRRAAGFA